MSGKHQGLRYFQKFLNSKASERNALAKKVLRYVLAVGFVLSPWLGGEAYAGTPEVPGIVRMDNTQYLNGANDVANIYPEIVDEYYQIGLNRFTKFNVADGQVANLHFQDINGRNPVQKLINTVNGRIDIQGTVNAMKNGSSGGNLYFLSSKGMVVGANGVINAGNLTVLTLQQNIIDSIHNSDKPVEKANDTLVAVNDYIFDSDAHIDVYGNIIANGDVKLRSMYVHINVPHTDNVSTGNTSQANALFSSIVNTKGIDVEGDLELQAEKELKIENAHIESDGRLTLISGTPGNLASGTLDIRGSSNNAQYIKIEVNSSIDIDSNSSIISGNDINMHTETGSISNYGTIQAPNVFNIQAGKSSNATSANLINGGTITATPLNTGDTRSGQLSITARNSITNTNTIQASGGVTFTVGGNLTNNGVIESTSSNVQAHIGRNFKNIPVPVSANSSTLTGGIIEAGGNVQVDYELNTKTTGIGVATPEQGESPTIDGIYNSGTIEAKGDKDPDKNQDGTVNTNSGSGNIWLTSSYNITNYGDMKANRQITLNARDFLHNYGLIEGVTYLDIKSIMGYVYNHKDGVIRAKGGNIDLSSGQANLEIKGDDGTKKELYRKFTPIIIEGIVEATSDDDRSNQTREGNINITAYLGDIYVNGGTIETKPELGTNDEVKAVAGDVSLNAAQNITIGFETEKKFADDPTTQAGPNGENKDKYERDDEREYFINTSTLSQKAAEISGSNITLTSGSRATNTISISAVNNALTASDSIELNSGGNVTVGAGASVTLGGSLQLQGNNIYVAGVQRSGNPTEPLKVEANGAGGTDSAINSLNLNIAGDVLFNTLNVNTAEVNVSGDLQIKQLHVADQAHFTSNNTMIGVYGEATEPRGDQSDALYRDMGNGSDSWMGINIKSDGYQITNGTEIQNAFAGGTEYPVQMSSKLVDVDPQETLVENYGDVTGNFGRFDLVDDSVRPSGGIESTDQGSQTVLKQDENGLHIETSDNKVDNGPQIEAGDNKVDNGSQIEAGDDKENEDSQIEAGDKKKDKSKRDKKDKREKQKKDK